MNESIFKTDFQLLGIEYLPIPKGVNINEIIKIIGDDNKDIIFLIKNKGIVCSYKKVKTIKSAYKKAIRL